MEIHIKLAGVELGPYSLRHVQESLAEGWLTPSDLARAEGKEDWETLAEVLARMSPDIAPAAPSQTKVEVEPITKSASGTSPTPVVTPVAPILIKKAVELARTPPSPVNIQKPPEVIKVARAVVIKTLGKKTAQGVNAPPTQAILTSSPDSPRSASPDKVAEPVERTFPSTGKASVKKWEPEAEVPPAVPVPASLGSPPLPSARQDKLPDPSQSGSPTKVKALVENKEAEAKAGPAAPASMKTEPFSPAGSEPNASAKLPEVSPGALPSLIKVLAKKTDRGAKPASASAQVVLRTSSDTPLPGAIEKAPEAGASKMVSPPPTRALPKASTQMALAAPVTVPAKPDAPVVSSPAASVAPKEGQTALTVERAKATTDIVSRRRQIQPAKVFACIGFVCLALVLLGVLYCAWPYYTASAVRKALSEGNQNELAGSIDFPTVRQSLKEQIETQIPKSGVPDASGNTQDSASSAVRLMINNSIDYFVTPDGITALVRDSGSLAKTDQITVTPEVAATILREFNSLPVRSEGLASLNEFVIDLGDARLHLHFYGIGWKLNRIEVKTNLQFPTLPVSSTSAVPSINSGVSVAAPVVDTYLAQGNAKYQKGDWSGAIDDFTQVLNINPKSTDAYNNRGMARMALQPTGDFDGAIADFNQAIALDPNLAPVYYSRANAKLAKGDQDGGLADLTQSINLDPKQEGAYFKRGEVITSKGDYDGAITDFSQVIEIDPNQANAYSNRGADKQAKNDLEGAIADFTQALAIDPKIAVAYYNRGLAKQAQGNLDGAILDFDQALDLDPKIAGAYYNRGNSKNTKHDLDGAIADYNQAVALDPKNALAFCNRGLAKQAKGDFDGAMDDYTQALTLDPKIAVAYYNRGLIREQKDDFDGSIADSSRALDLDPKEAQAYYNRGFAKLSKGNLDGAETDLKQFCELVPRDHYSDHARLYLWLIIKARDAKADANQGLIDSLQNDWNSAPDDLISKVAAFLLDRMNEADLIAAAASDDVKKDQGQHCEVWYFAGMKRLLSGDKHTAIDYFHKCLATGEKDYCEYILAEAELQVLEAAPQNPSPPTPPSTPASSPPKPQPVPALP